MHTHGYCKQEELVHCSAGAVHTPTRSGKRKASGRTTASPGSGSSPVFSTGSRYDSSLGMLTKKFLNLIEDTEDGILDLNKAADLLKVQKRRIYDITNVLEGVGVIEKKSKNNIQWKANAPLGNAENQVELEGMQQDIELLEEEARILDEHVQAVSEALKRMSEDPCNQERLYITDEDLTSLPCFANDSIFAVKAPPGTTLEVPDPEENGSGVKRRYKILLKSTTGPIDVYLVQHPQNAALEQEKQNSKTVPTSSGQRPSEPAPSATDTGRVNTEARTDATHWPGDLAPLCQPHTCQPTVCPLPFTPPFAPSPGLPPFSPSPCPYRMTDMDPDTWFESALPGFALHDFLLPSCNDADIFATSF